ncbi:MAG: hypothetical protein J7L90_01270 [Dehalococcoidia bacterium]|nr:hypothetical protein [Dehalococcoidia bacterium]
MAVNKDKIREIYEVLPKLDCGFCGFGSCGQFARAVAEGKASPFGCRQNPRAGYKISELIGVKVPAYSYQFQPSPLSPLGSRSLPQDLKKQVRTLSQNVNIILGRIEKLEARQ